MATVTVDGVRYTPEYTGKWTKVIDEDGNLDIPDDGREVMVFLCGDRSITAPRPGDAGWGIRLGRWDTDKHRWRCGMTDWQYVTHWMDLPSPPESAR